MIWAELAAQGIPANPTCHGTPANPTFYGTPANLTSHGTRAIYWLAFLHGQSCPTFSSTAQNNTAQQITARAEDISNRAHVQPVTAQHCYDQSITASEGHCAAHDCTTPHCIPATCSATAWAILPHIFCNCKNYNTAQDITAHQWALSGGHWTC